jgi:hypothetical protein
MTPKDLIDQHWEKRATVSIGHEVADRLRKKREKDSDKKQKVQIYPGPKRKPKKDEMVIMGKEKSASVLKVASVYEEAMLRAHVKEAYAANGVLPPAFEEAFFQMEKEAVLGQVMPTVRAVGSEVVGGIKRFGAGMRGAGLKMQAGAAGPQGLMGHLQRGAGKAISTVGRTIQKNPGAATAAGVAGLAGHAAGRLGARRQQQPTG